MEVVKDVGLMTCERMVIAMVQYSSLCEGAVVDSLDGVDTGEEVLVRVSSWRPHWQVR